jgi:hypothetical protein
VAVRSTSASCQSSLWVRLTLLVLDALQPLIIDRYLCVWFPMASASLAAIAADSSFDVTNRVVCATASTSVDRLAIHSIEEHAFKAKQLTLAPTSPSAHRILKCATQ